LFTAVFKLPQTVGVHLFQQHQLATKPVVFKNNIGTHLGHTFSVGTSKERRKIGSMNLVIFNLGRSSHDRIRTWEIVESTLFAEHLTFTDLPQNKILLLLLVKDNRFHKDIRELLTRIKLFANASEDEVEVVTLLLKLLNLESSGHHFFLEIYLEVLNESLR
tara:strand:+ start:526 stop:1011 length:486 start_codon:yes stop_codon:yes gene_type:complete